MSTRENIRLIARTPLLDQGVRLDLVQPIYMTGISPLNIYKYI